METQPNAFGIQSDHAQKMKPTLLYQHPQVSLFGVKDNPLALNFHYETPVGKNWLDR